MNKNLKHKEDFFSNKSKASLAAVHSFSEPGSFQENINTCFQIIEELEQKQVDFALFPELCISGYTKDLNILAAFESQQEEISEQLRDFSKEKNMAFSLGLPLISGEKRFISQQVFHKGELVSIHCKTHLGPTEKEVYSEGNELDVCQLPKIQLGQQICFESHFPELSAIQAAKGAEVLCFSFASPKESASDKLERLKSYLRARAYDNSCFVLACNSGGTNDKGDNLSGLSLCIDPKGNLLKESIDTETPYIICEIDKNELNRIRNSRMACFNQHKKIKLIKDSYDKLLSKT